MCVCVCLCKINVKPLISCLHNLCCLNFHFGHCSLAALPPPPQYMCYSQQLLQDSFTLYHETKLSYYTLFTEGTKDITYVILDGVVIVMWHSLCGIYCGHNDNEIAFLPSTAVSACHSLLPQCRILTFLSSSNDVT